jgi:hypothetical protein
MYAPFSKSNFHSCGPFHFIKELYLVCITLIYDFQTLSMKPLTIRIIKKIANAQNNLQNVGAIH